MALYQNLNHRREEEAERWTTLKHRGFGQAKHVSLARPARKRVEMVRSSNGGRQGRRGLLRTLLGLGLCVWAAAQFRPLKRLADLNHARKESMAAISQAFKSKPAADAENEAHLLTEAEAAENEAPSPEAAKAIQVDKFREPAVALASLGNGGWAELDIQGYARLSKGPDDPDHFGLPQLKGLAVKNVLEGRQWVRKADFKGGLAGLFPLPPELSPEVAWMDLRDPLSPRVVTHDNVVALLGLGPYPEKFQRLAAVLADLAARDKRPQVIDMRFEGSAVVRLASR